MTEIEKTKAEIKVLEKKLSFLEELEKTKSPVEEAYKDWMGVYPPTNPSVDNIFDIRWRAFQMGYNASKEKKVSESFQAGYEFAYQQNVSEWEPTPQTPEQVADGLKGAFREAVKQGVVSSSTKPQNLTDLIYDWWEDVFTTNSNDDMETSIEDLVDRIELFLPKEQSSAGSQNEYVECTVDGFNDCLKKIKGKLR
jgi:hypothetical protein